MDIMNERLEVLRELEFIQIIVVFRNVISKIKIFRVSLTED